MYLASTVLSTSSFLFQLCLRYPLCVTPDYILNYRDQTTPLPSHSSKEITYFSVSVHVGLMCELLWSDPQPQIGRSPSKRGVGIQFGPDVTNRFLRLNNLDYIIRSHEVKQEGYEVAHNGKCITVFSAPNYW